MNWKSILLNGLVTGVVTIGTGVLLFWWQAKEPKLTYNYVKSISFEDSGDRVYIQQFEISNSGDKTAEDVALYVGFPQAVVEKAKIVIDNSLVNTKAIGADSISIRVEDLNPGEGFSISAMVKSKSEVAVEPTISLRAKGITGEKVGSVQKKSYGAIIISLAAAYAGVFAFAIVNKRTRNGFLVLLGRRHGAGDQRDNLASILAMYGLVEKAREYAVSEKSRKYWIEADLLAAEAINSDLETKGKILLVLKHISGFRRLVPTTQGIIFYNIARIYKSDGDPQFEDYLHKSRAVYPEVDARMLIDPVFV
ncbi:MAG TPA: hypothetical protein DCE83_00160 [Enterococcus sp.]|nr:hypothetical protein [Enterococcus sp.]